MRTRSNNNFYDSDDLSTILRLSMKLCGKETTSVRRSRTPVQYWNRMFRLWRTKTSVIGYNVVYAALYCTHWGTYPVDMPSKPELRMLVDLVRRQFERVNADMKCAKEHFFFSTSLNDVLNSDSPHLRSSIRWTSACYRAFLMAKTQYKLYGAFYEIDNLNLLTTSVEEFVDMKSAAETRQLYETVKGYIVKLIPCASTWSDDQFSNDAAIIMHLKNLYKIDYIECPDSFDSLIKAFDAIDADEDVEHRLLVVGDMTLALAKVIWPYETEKQIENLFCWGCTQISKYIRFGRERGADMSYNIAAAQQEIHSTWAYRQITSWNEDKSYKLSMDTKKWLYQAEIGIF